MSTVGDLTTVSVSIYSSLVHLSDQLVTLGLGLQT
jgi:hypothetical protein